MPGYTSENFYSTPAGMRRVKLLANIVVAGIPDVSPGDIFDAPGQTAHDLIINGWAVETSEALRKGNAVQAPPAPEVVIETPPDKSSRRKPSR